MPVKHPTHVNLSSDTREKVIAILDARLADAVDLSIQAKVAHWNVRGMHFMSLHLLFDKVAEQAQESADDIAERIGQLGGFARANLQQTASATSLPEYPSDISRDADVVKAVAIAMAAFSNQCRADIDTTDKLGDMATSDLLTEIVRDTDKNLWFVESHLQ